MQPPVGQSVYDLREDEQLALAMQQSLAEEEGDPDGAAGAVARSSRAALLTPDTGGAPEEVPLQGPEPPRERPPDPSARPDETMEAPTRCPDARSSDPEWAGSAEEAAGGGAPVYHPPVPPPRPAPASFEEVRLLDEAVHRALDFAKARQFDEAERCLAMLSREHPEFAESKEMKAAYQTVAMCKQLNDG
eukprot:symbB.v1.2.007102.t1/scaffold431.1/size205911/15